MTKPSSPSPTPPKTPGKGKGNTHGLGGGKSKRPGRPEGIVEAKAKEGRPPGLSPEAHKEIVYNVAELAMPESEACLAAGFDPSTVSKWKTRGNEAHLKWDTLTPRERAIEGRYLKFFTALRDARPKYIRANLETIAQAAKKDWRAADRRLEIVDRMRFGRKVLVGNDPKHPLPTTPVLGAVMILPNNGRLKAPAAPAASPTQAKDPAPDDGSAAGRPDGDLSKGV